jgi:GntR family transcriptional regulator, galactonate operon transcriptional repressor
MRVSLMSGVGGETDKTGASTSDLHNDVVETMARRIVEGEYKPGQILPTVEELAEAFDVSRTVVRESLKVLSAKGFVEAKRRAGTRVLGRSDWSLMDRDVLSWLYRGDNDVAFARALLQMRRIVEPEAAALAAENATAADLAAMEDAFLRMSASLPNDLVAWREADVEFHTALLKASGNMFLEQLAHTIRFALQTLFRMTTRAGDSHGGALAGHGRLIEHIRARHVDSARQEMRDLLALAASRLNK